MAHYQIVSTEAAIPYEDDVLRLRGEGMKLREIAETLGIALHRVDYVMRKHHAKAGQRAGRQRKIVPPSMTIDDALDLHDAIYIERGLNGGYVVTVADRTGREEKTLRRAIGSAVGRESD